MCIHNWSGTQYFKAALAVSTPHGRNVNTALRSCLPHDELDSSVTTLDQEIDPLAGVHYTDLKLAICKKWYYKETRAVKFSLLGWDMQSGHLCQLVHAPTGSSFH